MSPTVPNYTRRRFLTGTATLGAGVAMSPLLAACASDDAASPEPTASTSSTTTSTSTTTPPTSTTAPATTSTTEPAQTFERFGHGSPGIPGGAAGTPDSVIVIGAGIAGLTAARALHLSGVDVKVLEGRERLGGRIHTADLGGSPLDLGASWIHEPTGNPLDRYRQLLGIDVIDADLGTIQAVVTPFDLAAGRALTPEEAGSAFTALFLLSEDPATQLALLDALGPDASAQAGLDALVAQLGYSDEATRHAAAATNLLALGEAGRLDDVALTGWNDDLYTLYDGPGDTFPVGGMRTIIDATADGLDITLNTEVTTIEYSDSGVVVTTRTDSRIEERNEASHVIVTAPLGVLKAKSISFSPALPAGKLAAIDALGWDGIEKVAARFDEAFWSDSSPAHGAAFAENPTEINLLLDHHTIANEPILASLQAPGLANKMSALGDDQVFEAYLARLAAMFGDIPEPAAIVRSNWSTDPFSMGAYSHQSDSKAESHRAALAEPVAGRVLFAGEHTSYNRWGTVDGAMRSGIREAMRLLDEPDVPLVETTS